MRWPSSIGAIHGDPAGSVPLVLSRNPTHEYHKSPKKGKKVKLTEQNTKTPSTATGLSALLGVPRHTQGSGASKAGRARLFALAVLASMLGLLLASPAAFAGAGYRSTFSFASPEGFSGPVGLAVDDSAGSSKGDVYVVDQGNNALKKFSVSGTTATQEWKAEFPGGATPNQATVDD